MCVLTCYTLGNAPKESDFSHEQGDFEHFVKNNALHFFRSHEKGIEEAIQVEPNSKLAQFMLGLRKTFEDGGGSRRERDRGPPRRA